MNSLTIRSAQSKDCATLLSLIRGLAVYEKLAHEVVATEADLRRTLFEKPTGAEAVLAELDGRAVGFALFFHNYSTFLGKPGLYLEDLFVLESERGAGIGLKLLKHLAQIALERGCGRMEWWVLDWNKPAIRFYERLGAKPMDEWTVFRLTEEKIRALAQLSS